MDGARDVGLGRAADQDRRDAARGQRLGQRGIGPSNLLFETP